MADPSPNNLIEGTAHKNILSGESSLTKSDNGTDISISGEPQNEMSMRNPISKDNAAHSVPLPDENSRSGVSPPSQTGFPFNLTANFQQFVSPASRSGEKLPENPKIATGSNLFSRSTILASHEGLSKNIFVPISTPAEDLFLEACWEIAEEVSKKNNGAGDRFVAPAVIVVPPEPIPVFFKGVLGEGVSSILTTSKAPGVPLAVFNLSTSQADIRARFPDALWNDATVFADNIIKYSPPVVSQKLISSVPPAAKQQSISELPPIPVSASPKSFAAAVQDQAADSRVGQNAFSGEIPTVIFSKEDCAQCQQGSKKERIRMLNQGYK